MRAAFATVLVLMAVGGLLKVVAVYYLIRVVESINDKSPVSEQMFFPFPPSLRWKALRRTYAAMYPDGDLHTKCYRLSLGGLVSFLAGVVALLWR